MSIPGVSTDIETVITPDTDTTFEDVLIGDGEKVKGGSFESVRQNIRSLPHVPNYTGELLTSVVYTLPNASTITKTVNYTGDKITSIVLSGTTPSGIQLTKTFTYTGDKITGVSYS